VLFYTFVQQHHVQQLLLASITLDLHEDEDDAIESSLQLNFLRQSSSSRECLIPFPTSTDQLLSWIHPGATVTLGLQIISCSYYMSC
jgi:hypothetical protein